MVRHSKLNHCNGEVIQLNLMGVIKIKKTGKSILA